MIRICSVLILALITADFAHSQEFSILPAKVTLTGPRASQQLLLVTLAQGRVTGDFTEKAKFTSSNPKIATVDNTGRVRPTGNGTVKIRATLDQFDSKAIEMIVTCESFDKPIPATFNNDVQPILTRTGCNSGSCHGALAGKGGLQLSLRGYDSPADHFALTRQALARRVDRENPVESLLLAKATRTMPHGGGTRFDTESDHYRTMLDWIRGGAPGPDENGTKPVKIEVFPKSAILKPKQAIRVIATATYTDGTTRDVTHLAKFVSSEEQAATVDEDGKVTVAGRGETAVSAIFSNLVSTCSVVVPFDVKDAKLFDGLGRSNFVDDHINTKLKLLRLPPSERSTDAEFIRRVYLDACGILPKPDEVTKFLADTSKDKRSKLIDAVLNRPEYVDYWTHKWSDLLLISSRKLSQPAVWSFYKRVRASVADNEPWDKFAHDVITASGSTLTNGAANYYVLHKDVTDVSESTAVTFMGMSITCARCHNHPLEKWTQDQYWQLANVFSRVGSKNGERTGEFFVQSLPEGESLHLRRGIAMAPTPLDGKPLPLDSTIDRREYFAQWLTSPSNPFFAKAIVNRVWRNYMGRGLIEAEDDIRETNPPTNPELLAALVDDFVKNKFDMKHLMRTILNSQAYQRSSRANEYNAADDRFYSHYLLRRLSAEVILDAYSDVSNVPTPFNQLSLGPSGGTQNSTAFPAGTRAIQLPDSLLVSQFLDSFGRAERLATCSCEITKDSSVAQALHLNNGQTLNVKLRDDKSIVKKWITDKSSDEAIVKELFLRALSRPPSDKELQKFVNLMKTGDTKNRQETLEDVVWAVLTNREFLFNR